MTTSGAVTLGNIKLPMLEVACSRRHGRLSVAKSIEQHGENAKLTNLIRSD